MTGTPGNDTPLRKTHPLRALDLGKIPGMAKLFWPRRRVMQRRKRFGTLIENIPSLRWYEFGELYRDKLRVPRRITFAFVATHNHFVLDRGGKVFKQSAPVIKLQEGATRTTILRCLACSTAPPHASGLSR